MSFRFAALLAVLSLFVAPLAPAQAGTATRSVRILAVVPAPDASLRVHYFTDGEMARGLFVPFANIINAVKVPRRNQALAETLIATNADYMRGPVLLDALSRRLAARSPMFVVEGANPADGPYLDAAGAPTAKAAEQGYDYVLAVDDVFTGLTMRGMVSRSDELVVASTVQYRLYQAADRKLLDQDRAWSNALEARLVDDAVRDAAFFRKGYAEAVDGMANVLAGLLFRKDILHAMAAGAGRGDEMPAVGSVFKRYEKQFAYSFSPLPGWKRTKMTSNYVHVLEPRSDLALKMGLRFEVDVLAPEFGQDVATIEEYMAVFDTRRLAHTPGAAPMEAFEDYHAPAGYVVRTVANAEQGGRTILLFRKVDDDLVEIVSLVFAREFDSLYAAHRAEMEAMVGSAQLKLKGSTKGH